MKGNVKFFNARKGFGFIAGEDGKEYFAHVNDLAGVDPMDLQENTAVVFEVTQGDRGPKAANVKLDQGGDEAPAEAPAEEAPAEEAPAEEAPAEEKTE